MKRETDISAHTARRVFVYLGVAAGTLGLGPQDSSAQEFCVSCTQPNAVYRCVIDGARPGGQSLRMLCLTALAKDGGHAECSVKGGTVFDCNGPVKRVPWTTQDAGRVSEPPAASAPPSEQKPADKGAHAPKGEPKTVVDMAKQAKEQMQKAGEGAKDQAKSAGQAIGDATKKTWNCMLKFFIGC